MSWIGRLLRRGALEHELDKELQFHMEAATDDLVRSGVSPTEARRLARIEFGGVEQVKEGARDARGTRWLEEWWSDTRYALRTMARTPGFTAAAIVTLAIGVGANTAVWSISDALMRRALPVADPEELHQVSKVSADDRNALMSRPLMEKLQVAAGDSIQIAGFASIARLYAAIGEQPEPVLAQLVSGNFFSTVRVRAQVGRMLTADDDRTLGAGAVAVLTDRFWTQRFGRNPAVVGRTLRMNGMPMTVVGVAQPDFDGLIVGFAAEVFAPLTMQHELRYMANASAHDADLEKPWGPQNGVNWLTLITRVDPAHAKLLAAHLDVPFRADLEQQIAGADSASRAYALREHLALESISRGFSPLRAEFGDPLRALMGSVGLILLIACANLAALMLARSAARTHETAVRIALGARPGRLVRQTLTESLTLAALGGILGLAVAQWTTRGLLRLASSGARAIPLQAHVDARVLAFAFGVTFLAGLLFGLAPALRARRADLHASFKVGGRVVSGGHRLPLGRTLVIAQVALSLVLVAAAGVFVRTFQNLLSIDPGFERETLAAARIDVRSAGYRPEQLPALYDRLLAEVRAIPGVRSASLSLHGLAAGSRRTSSFTIPGRALAPGQNTAQENFVTPDFFRTTDIQLLSGRAFTDRDRKDTPMVVVLTQTAARKFFGTDSVIGQRLGSDSALSLEVVGLVRDVLANSVREPAPPLIFHALAQNPSEYISSIEARFTGDPGTGAMDRAMRRAIASVDRDLPVREVVTVEELVERSLSRERMVARLAGAFGLLALLLAAVGLYGVISYSVARRTNEMGVRLALGASQHRVSWVVLRESLDTTVTGLVVGVLLWFPLLTLTRTLLYGLSPHDLMVLATSTLLLLVVATLAAAIPAVRAARIDPIQAIRAE